MSGIVINHDKCILCNQCVDACPFNALDNNGKIEVNANCKVCQICLKQCPVDAITLEEAKKVAVNKEAYSGILVFVEHFKGDIHPVTIELIGKAQELASITKQDVNCLMIGSNIEENAKELLEYGVNKVFVYDNKELEYFKVDSYANVFEDCIKHSMPSSVLVGATTTGRSLAPRVATRFKTGLTADCTVLEMRENSDLVQIRPAFGGNIMAQILTENSRPQFATVRYKVMDMATKKPVIGEVVTCEIEEALLKSAITINSVVTKPEEIDISSAEVLVVAGNGIKDDVGFELINELAKSLGGMVAATRPVIERGEYSYLNQVGLSGRTVKPKLIINCGVSGAIQYTAGMNQSDVIVSINTDPNAEIFNHSHYAIVGDLYEIVPQLISKIKGGSANV